MSLQDDLLQEHIEKLVKQAVRDGQEERCAVQGHQVYEKDEFEYSEQYPKCRWCRHYLTEEEKAAMSMSDPVVTAGREPSGAKRWPNQ